MNSRTSILMLLLLLVSAGLALAAEDASATCAVVPGDFILKLSGFGGGAPSFYPIALVGKMTVEANGDVAGGYKQHAPMMGGVQASKSFTGTLKINKDCSGTLTVKDGARTTHSFTVYMGKEAVLTLAVGDTGLILSGDAKR